MCNMMEETISREFLHLFLHDGGRHEAIYARNGILTFAQAGNKVFRGAEGFVVTVRSLSNFNGEVYILGPP